MRLERRENLRAVGGIAMIWRRVGDGRGREQKIHLLTAELNIGVIGSRRSGGEIGIGRLVFAVACRRWRGGRVRG